jgi:DNA replication protein DnaC
MNQPTQALEHASVRQYCKALRMPVMGANFVRLSEQAIKEQRSHIGYLEALLTMESEERDRHAVQNRIRDAKLPRLKTLEEFDFNQTRQIPAANAPSRWCSWASAARARRIWRRACAWPRAAISGGRDSPPLRIW